VARVRISAEQARWASEDRASTLLADGSVLVEWPYKGTEYLVREVLKEAGDAVVLEPAEARDAVLHAAERLLAPSR
jgi:proteasome accessory factor C